MTDSPLRIGLIGLGTVGSSVVRILNDRRTLIASRAGRSVEVARAAVRDVARPRPGIPDTIPRSTDPLEVATAEDVDVVVELMGGVDTAEAVVSAALQAGKPVVTANKALLCERGDHLFGLASEHSTTLSFEAAIAGGIPVVAAMNQSLTGNRVSSIDAILNGTSNFILTEMLDAELSYEESLRAAQAAGLAEADPTMDVDGTDAAQKLSLLVRLAFGNSVRPREFLQNGIQDLELLDLKFAENLGYRIKLLATACFEDGRLQLSVQPTLIRANRPLARASGADNVVVLHGDMVGRLVFGGAGAGGSPTASAVVADIIDVATGRASATFAALRRQEAELNARLPVLQSPEEFARRYYLRFNVDDKPHVLADVAHTLGRHEISLLSVRQDEPQEDDATPALPHTARLVFMTHKTTEGRLRAATQQIAELPTVHGLGIRLPVAD